jgi:hypothetical protein
MGCPAPHTHAHLKLLSSSRMSDASLAMEVPAAIANPTSAAFSAGASLVPSPVTAMVSISSPRARSAFTACRGGGGRGVFNGGGGGGQWAGAMGLSQLVETGSRIQSQRHSHSSAPWPDHGLITA